MKIRWTPNSVRFRITPAELESLKNAQPVEAVLLLGESAAWSARIETCSDAGSTLRFTEGVLLLQLSPADLETLAAPENEGVYLRDGELRFFVEKDFPCAHPRASETDEPHAETFAPPVGFEERKNS